MSALYIVFPLALLIAAGAVVLFIWAVRSGQFDDTETPGMRILHDDEWILPSTIFPVVEARRLELEMDRAIILKTLEDLGFTYYGIGC
mgnify:CR=1 FL=1